MRWFVPMLVLAALHLVLAIGCLVALTVDAPAIGGAHLAMKPLKFAVSVGILLASVALVLRCLDVSDTVRWVLASLLSLTMIVEMVAIVGQAIRGRPSHYNTATPLDAALWYAMGAAIVVAMIALVVLALLAIVRPLRMDPLVAAGVRIGLWLLLLVAFSGVAMGGRGQHGVGGPDGGQGMAITQWSRTHGDLRVPHFFAVHGLQVLPIVALLLVWIPIADRGRWFVFALCALVWCAISVGTLAQAMRGRPLVASHSGHDPPHHLYAAESRQ
jgi:hypothetical protein